MIARRRLLNKMFEADAVVNQEPPSALSADKLVPQCASAATAQAPQLLLSATEADEPRHSSVHEIDIGSDAEDSESKCSHVGLN